MNTPVFSNFSPTLLTENIHLVLLLKCVGPHKFVESKVTELPTGLSNITTGDSKHLQSSDVGGL